MNHSPFTATPFFLLFQTILLQRSDLFLPDLFDPAAEKVNGRPTNIGTGIGAENDPFCFSLFDVIIECFTFKFQFIRGKGFAGTVVPVEVV